MERFALKIGSDHLVGYWHWPDGPVRRRAAIIMGHGFGAEWTFGTAETIADFTEAGFAVATFDYRHFGESEGRPRHLLLVERQLEDWRTVLSHVRRDSRIDGSRVAIWGASLGGGHALTIAAEGHGIAAAVVQTPHCRAFDVMMATPPLTSLAATQHAMLDFLFAHIGGVHSIPMVSEPGRLGAMSFAGWGEESARLIPPGSSWKNAFPARSLLSLAHYNPERAVRRISCPVCIHYGRRDASVSPETVERTAGRIADVETHSFDGEHFDVYHGEIRAAVAAKQIDFLHRRLAA